MASTYLQRTPSGAGNRKTWTWSGWIKTATTSGDKGIFSASTDASNRNAINLSNEGYFLFDYEVGGTRNVVSSQSATYRDINGWYHLVVAVDTTQATDTNRVKMYVNGSQITLTGVVNSYPSQNADMFVNNTVSHSIGRQDWGTNYFNGSMSHVHFIDGTAYTPSAFGETDATTGEWKINTSPSVTYGTNGFFILKNGNSVTDQSGNSNNFTVGGGTLTKTEDNPSNVFATLNPLNLQTGTKPILQYGNTSVSGASDGGTEFNGSSTLGMSTGKFYMEFKSTVSSNVHTMIGITSNPSEDARSDHWMGTQSYSYGYYANDGKYYNGNTAYTYGNTYTSDIIGVALDLDNNKLYFSKNGTWQNSGVPTSGSTGTGAISITDNEYFFGVSDASGTYISSGDCNFGNGYFGTTAVSSAGTNASGIGIFEYDVPTGYTALSTKGLNE